MQVKFHILVKHINPQMPKVKIHLRTPKGGGVPPWILVFPSEFFKNISHGYVFGVKESNGDNDKILYSLHDFENQGQTPFCMTFHISGCKHDTKLILVSILTFLRSRISKMLKTIPWFWRLTLEFKVTHIHCMTFINSSCIHDFFCTTFHISDCKHDTKSISVSILTFSRSRISRIMKTNTWLHRLTLKLKVIHLFHMTSLISGCMPAIYSILVSILTYSRSRISENLFPVTWPWCLTLIFKVKPLFFKFILFSRSVIINTLFISNFLSSSTSIMLNSILKSSPQHVFSQRWWRSFESMFDLDFQGQLWKSSDILLRFQTSDMFKSTPTLCLYHVYNPWWTRGHNK